jgi:sugar lactone lactonase YvrE
LGLRFIEPNWIYLVDSFNGLFKVNIDNGEKTHILNSNNLQFGEHKPKYLNDLDIDSEGNIYFTDSSYRRNVNEAVELFVEGNVDGRLFVFNEKTNHLNLLLDNIHFANGVQLTPNSTALLVSETHMARILKYC